MTEMFGEAWSPMSVPDLAPDDDDEEGFELLQMLPLQFNGCENLYINFIAIPIAIGISNEQILLYTAPVKACCLLRIILF